MIEKTFGGSMEVARTPVNSDSGKPRIRPKHKKTKRLKKTSSVNENQ